MRLSDRSSGSISPRFSRQRRMRATSSSPRMMRASESPMKPRRPKLEFLGISNFMTSSVPQKGQLGEFPSSKGRPMGLSPRPHPFGADLEEALSKAERNFSRGLIPNPIDQNPWAHWRSPMDMMRQG